ncbi:MAG: hypothetical protein WAW59_07620 [Patescibacteria group bacterium]
MKSISGLSQNDPNRAKLAKQLETTNNKIMILYKRLLTYRDKIAELQKKIAQIKTPPVVTST